MGLDKVVEEVMSSGKRRRQDILEDAEAEAKTIINDAKAQVERYRSDREEDNRLKIDRTRVQEMQTAELEIRKLELIMHRELLEKVEEDAREQLRRLDRPRRETLLKVILSRYEIPGGKVYSSAQDEGIVRALTSMRYAETIDCIGGVVIESADGSVREDHTFDSLLKEKNEAMLAEIADILFGEGGSQ
jgi:V/A-type H+-transporting ATPase subunit E